MPSIHALVQQRHQKKPDNLGNLRRVHTEHDNGGTKGHKIIPACKGIQITSWERQVTAAPSALPSLHSAANKQADPKL